MYLYPFVESTLVGYYITYPNNDISCITSHLHQNMILGNLPLPIYLLVGLNGQQRFVYNCIADSGNLLFFNVSKSGNNG